LEAKIMPRNLLGVVVSLLLAVTSAFAQTHHETNPATSFQVLYNFTDYSDGCCIAAGVARDRGGNLYGVAYLSHNEAGFGDLYKLTPSAQGYKFQVLESFDSSNGGCMGTPTIDAAGNVFGVCRGAGIEDGTLWEYSRGKFSVLHTFNGPTDGMDPVDSVAIDNAGNLYGTAYTYGPGQSGTLWKYSQSSGFTVLHAFANGADGALLMAGPRIDAHGKIWGTTATGPNCYYCGSGTVWNYDLTSGTFTTVLDFGTSGILDSQSRLAFDAAGNVYGTAFGTTHGDCGLVYELQKSNNYAPVIAYAFTGSNDGCDPFGSLILDSAGNIFGTAYSGGAANAGTVYELTPADGAWQETTLHSFSVSDGDRPQSGLVTDGQGNWFGTTAAGGSGSWGTVFELSGVK
jgi:uncharacterized repeat protein (TIGR03803 family)